METLTILKLIKDLSELLSSLEGKSILECKRLLKITKRTLELIHDKPSFDEDMTCEFHTLETELRNKRNEIRKVMLKQILANKAEYEKNDLKECWEDFVLATRLNYGSYSSDGSGWSGEELAKKAKKMLCPIVLEKLTALLETKKLPKEKRIEALKMLYGVHARHNGGDEEYTIAQKLLEKFDTKKEIGSMEYV